MKYERWMAVSDNHGDKQNAKAVSAALEFAKHWKPGIRLHLGDAFDFRCFRKNASQDESRDSIKADVEMGLEFIGKYKPTVFLRGNHDERLWDAAGCDDGKIADFASYLILDVKDALGDIPVLPYDKRKGVYKLGHLKAIHGYTAGITAAKRAAEIYGAVMMGHVHAIDQYSIAGIERRVGRSIGALCELCMDYNRGQANTLRQAHGWAYGLKFPNGDYTFWQAEEVGGGFYMPSEFREIRGNAKPN